MDLFVKYFETPKESDKDSEKNREKEKLSKEKFKRERENMGLSRKKPGQVGRGRGGQKRPQRQRRETLAVGVPKIKKKLHIEKIDDDQDYDENSCMKFFYPKPKDMRDVEDGGYNLSCDRRPWKGGRKAFNDASQYRPKDLDNFVTKHYMENFTKRGKRSPFAFQEDYINMEMEDLCVSTNFDLKPQQKFAGQYICPQTDFPGELIYHGLGKLC